MKRLVTAALTAATAAIAGSAIALTPVYAQEVPPEPTAEPSATPAQIRTPASGSNIVVFVIPESVGELTDAACSVDEVAEETSSKSMMRFGKHEQGHTSTTHEISRGARTSDDSEDSDDSVGLPSEACTTLRGLFASLAGLVPQASVTDGATDVAIDDDEDSARTEDEDAINVSETENSAAPGDDDTDEDDGTDGALTPASRTSVYVTIFAGGDAGEDGCTLDELIADASGAVPVVEAGGEVPLQGAADVSDVALPAEVCALLSALFSTAPATGTNTATAPEDEATAMPVTSDDAGDASDTEADDNDEADGNDEADDENDEADEADDDEDESSTPAAGSTTAPSSSRTTTPTGTVTATPTTTSTATPTATGTPEADEADDEEEEADSGGDAP